MTTRSLILLLLTFVGCGLYAQSGGGKGDATASEEHSRLLWVKLGSNYTQLLSGTTGARTTSLPGVVAAQPLVKGYTRTSARSGPRKQYVDIQRYHILTIDDATPVREAIARLMATGFFDVVEPVPVNKPLTIPDDPSFSSQPYLNLIKAPEAWDITMGSEQMIIGIVDTGGDLDHPDLYANVYIDPNEPLDGVDNDGDGYVDNNRGWDFSGDVAALVGTTGFIGDNDPSVSKAGVFGHGTMVAGVAAASTNDGVGIASVGGRTKLLFTKHYSDDQDANSAGYSSNTYLGLIYAATHGARIINCSWGSYDYSTIAQDIINYVTLDLGCLVIAAAGNSNVEQPIYPASYEHVVSTGSSTITDERAFFSNYGRSLDLVAPGDVIYTTQYNDSYITDSGTSLSTPLVAGAAALVWSHYPEYSPLQVAEQLRVSADASIYDHNPAYLHKLGRGRLDVYAALTAVGPSVRVSNQRWLNQDDLQPGAGDVTHLVLDFTNYLEAASGLTATISTGSSYVVIDRDTYDLGSLATGETKDNDDAPFEIAVSGAIPLDHIIELLITISNGTYTDYQLINLSIPSYVVIGENNITTSLSANGRIGFGATASQRNGVGFVYNEASLLYEMGLIAGTSSSALFNNVRAAGGLFDDDFIPDNTLKKSTPGSRAYSEVNGGLAAGDLQIAYNSLVWDHDPYRNFVILEYSITNTGSTPVNDLYVGLFADWDVADHGARDRAGWDSLSRLGYVYSVLDMSLPRAGVQALTGEPQYHAIDNDQTVAGNPFGIYDGFTDDEKFLSVSEGVSRKAAGAASTGGDVSHTVGSGPYNLEPGQTAIVAFALHGAMTQDELIASAHYADSIYNYTLRAPLPVVHEPKICKDTEFVLEPEGAGEFALYKDRFGGAPIAKGHSLPIGPFQHDTILYVANADHAYESLRVPVEVAVVDRPAIVASGLLSFCAGDSVMLSAPEADNYQWSNAGSDPDIIVKTSGDYTVTTTRSGVTCISDTRTVVVHPLPDASFSTDPAVLYVDAAVVFTAMTDDAVSWLWDFGNGITVSEPTPLHIYEEEGVYEVALTVTDGNACTNTQRMTFGLITSAESWTNEGIYPNPVTGEQVAIAYPYTEGNVQLDVFDNMGRHVLAIRGDAGDLRTMDTSALRNGQYLIRVTGNGAASFVRKLVVSR